MNKKVLLLVASILIVIGLFRFSENTSDFSTFNPDWNGGMRIRDLVSERHQAVAIPSRHYIGSFEPDRTALVVLGPGVNFSEKDIDIIKKFVGDGGLLILADDFRSGNELLTSFSTSISFSSMLLLDDVNFWRNSSFPVVTTGIEGVSNITMNYPTSLIISDGSARVLASTGRFSWLSKNGLEREVSGSYPVMADLPFGQGKIVAIADPSIFINSMLPMGDNILLLDKLVENRTSVIFDETGRMPLIFAAGYLVRTDPYVQYLSAGIVVSFVLIYMNRDRLIFRKKKSNNQSYVSELDEKNIISDILKRRKWDERRFAFFMSKIRR
ncbi:hypothetical protein ANME2D_01240 [Candidatus Methanoperedens nitroreducens]|uniref:DUF4350 domain-containing protein n=1 Tax=Candidatus Methanoperedens nitratireducens TaxID=1392998 RepID=A0A062VBY0_9EURY|nr:DUF4350 domain-containing protein [Candidatus Methanoperedens nitroreducens]KCZ72805.1 hypothetical protein ANME2D_01240 [Candidatus Methanoperedens nitroreducens]MDJ1423265.1 DUF4350 domain-containing protein [Candidatus Methanoperedens sp.]